MSMFLIVAIVAVSALIGFLIYLLFGTIRAGLASYEREERLPAEAK
jgi:hypothetical protein